MRFILLALFVQNGGSLVMNNGDAEARGAMAPVLDLLGGLAGKYIEDYTKKKLESAIGQGVDYVQNNIANYGFGKVQAGVDSLQQWFHTAVTDDGAQGQEAEANIRNWANDPYNKLTEPGFIDGVMAVAAETAASAREVLNNPNLPSNQEGSYVAKFLATDPFEPGPGLQLEIAEQLGITVPPLASYPGDNEREKQLAALRDLSRDDQRKIFATAMATGEWEPPDMDDLGPKAMLEFVAKEEMTEAFTNFKNYDAMRDATIETGKKAMMDIAARLDASRLEALETLRRQQMAAQAAHAQMMQAYQNRAKVFQAEQLQPSFKEAMTTRGGNYLSHSMFDPFS